MQQPPHGRPPGQPYRPPAGGRPAGAPAPGAGTPPPVYRQPPPSPHGHPGAVYGGQAAAAPPPVAPVAPPAPGRKKRGSLRFLAGSCVFTAWLTLVVSVILAVVAVMSGFAEASTLAAAGPTTEYFPAPTPASPTPGLEDLGLPSPGGILGGGGAPSPGGAGLAGAWMLFKGILPFLYYGSAAFTLVTGLITFLLFLGLGQACYAILDLEEQTHQNADTLQLILARLSRS